MIAIVKYNAGNSRSVENAIKRLGYAVEITDSAERLNAAEKIILPGVGEASSAMKYLMERKLDLLLLSLKKPVLGICLGMQLMCKWSEEGNTNGIGIFDTSVKMFRGPVRIPHTGWNNLIRSEGPLFAGIKPEDDFYFVHSYFAGLCDQTIAVCDYSLPFSAAIAKDNFYGTQFHPEKSSATGMKVLKNFLEL
ncbi:MAG TPA: imidazole glycerol phosphate synthase subunit HisH [Bacteroidales bacterium]|nr:imidazole glycerol phosphate synthase subunit HisH [Bacteroidales bacterium]